MDAAFLIRLTLAFFFVTGPIFALIVLCLRADGRPIVIRQTVVMNKPDDFDWWEAELDRTGESGD